MANENPFNAQEICSAQLTSVMETISQVVSTPGASSHSFQFEFGEEGSNDGQFDAPTQVWGGGNELYVAEQDNNRIQVFNTAGTFQRKWGSSGSGDGQFALPSSGTLFSSEVYVCDSNNDRIQVFDTIGTFKRKWGSAGTGNGQFDFPSAIVGFNSEIYVCDELNHRVQVFNTAGTFQRKWGSSGSGDGQFNQPEGITVLNSEVYVSDLNNSRIQVFNTAGTFQRKWTHAGPHQIDADGAANELYVAGGVSGAKVISVYTSIGTLLRSFCTQASPPGAGEVIQGFGVVLIGSLVFVPDRQGHQMQVFSHGGIEFSNIVAGGFADADSVVQTIMDASSNLVPWVRYGSKGTVKMIGQPNGFASRGPEGEAYTMPIPQSDLLTGEHWVPTHVKILRDIRFALERIAALGSITNKVTGNPVTWEFSGSDDLYFSAVGNENLTPIGGTNQYNWQRPLAEVAGREMEDVDIAEIKLCADFLKACLAT